MNTKQVALLFFFLCLPITSQGGVWEERNALERYINQIEKLNDTLLEDAKQSADPNSRVQLDYKRLKQDSQEILNRLKHHLNAPLQTYKVESVKELMNEGKDDVDN